MEELVVVIVKKGDEEAPEITEAARIEKLLAEVNRLTGLIAPPAVKDIKTATTATVKTDSEVSKNASHAELVDFVEDLDMDDVASDPNILNQILNKVLKHGIEVLAFIFFKSMQYYLL